MGLRHPISPPPRTNITVGPAVMTLQWELIREWANQTLSELLLLVLELMLIVLLLSSAFSHVDSFLSPAQEAQSSSTTQPLTQLSSLESSSEPELLITSRSSVLESFINKLSLKSSPPSSSLPRSSLPRSPHSSSSLPVPVPVPAPPSVSSSLPRSSLQSSLYPSGPVSLPVLSIKPLLKELGLPATLASFRLLISLGVLDKNLLPSSLLAPASALVSLSSPPLYVPPHIRRQALVPLSLPILSSLLAPALSPALESSSSISPPLMRIIIVSKDYFYYYNNIYYLNKRGELYLGPKYNKGLVKPLPF
ncbi:hypothetical protein N431DRAFT_546123 [Stipitochalara longipes BDJ]|nr:hypothetical protein N431DRAFT_546123 [Stipitochalara longipes BDJ]